MSNIISSLVLGPSMHVQVRPAPHGRGPLPLLAAEQEVGRHVRVRRPVLVELRDFLLGLWVQIRRPSTVQPLATVVRGRIADGGI